MIQRVSEGLTLGILLGVLLMLTIAFYRQGRELQWLREHHLGAHRRETELVAENALLKERLRTVTRPPVGAIRNAP